MFSLFETSTPQLYLDIDRTKAQLLGINMPDVFNALQINLGSSYVNDFNLFGRTFRVSAQAERLIALEPKDVLAICACAIPSGDTVPLGSFTTVRDISGPYRVPRYNLYPAAELDGAAAPGYSQGQAIEIMQKLAAETLPDGFAYEWTTLAFQQLRAGNTAIFAFLLGGGVRVPGAGRAVRKPDAAARRHPDRADVPDRLDHRRGVARQDNNILTQVGFIVLIGAGGEERHPDRRIRQAARGPGPRPLRGRGRGGASCGCGRS